MGEFDRPTGFKSCVKNEQAFAEQDARETEAAAKEATTVAKQKELLSEAAALKQKSPQIGLGICAFRLNLAINIAQGALSPVLALQLPKGGFRDDLNDKFTNPGLDKLRAQLRTSPDAFRKELKFASAMEQAFWTESIYGNYVIPVAEGKVKK